MSSTATRDRRAAPESGATPGAAAPERDYALFDAEISGRSLDLTLLRRMGHWMAPYRLTFLGSAALILLMSTLQVLSPIILSLVVIDHILNGVDSGLAPDLGMVALNDWLTGATGSSAATLTPM